MEAEQQFYLRSILDSWHSRRQLSNINRGEGNLSPVFDQLYPLPLFFNQVDLHPLLGIDNAYYHTLFPAIFPFGFYPLYFPHLFTNFSFYASLKAKVTPTPYLQSFPTHSRLTCLSPRLVHQTLITQYAFENEHLVILNRYFCTLTESEQSQSDCPSNS